MKRKTQDPTTNPPSKKKKPHPNPQPKKPAREEPLHPSINELKRQIRNAKRLLARDDLPADTRIVQERALAEYERELGEETRRRERREMIGRYHFVRFLDRKSASKELKKLLRKEKDAAATAAKAGSEMEASSKESGKEDDAGNLAEKIHIARVNLNYTIYYPLTEKYISLYADKQQQKRKRQKKGISNGDADSQDLSDNDNDNGDGADSQQTPRPAMWYVVEKCMEEGQKKLELLREGQSGDVSASGVVEPEDNTGPGRPRSDRSKWKNKENGMEKDVEMRAAHDGDADADDSDGGFFEE